MNSISKPKEIRNKVVLIAALDWGMGHTTRCVSLIRTLIGNSNKVIFAGNSVQNLFIQRDFPDVQIEFLEGYNVQLDSRKRTYMQMARQQKRIMGAIKHENRWLNEYLEKNTVDLLISDNRYGFYHPEIPSIILTHQINLQVPTFKYAANWLIKRMIEKFDSCWVPDYSDRSLSGELSNGKLKIPIFFIGPLCRFKPVKAEKKYDRLVILSGPEPERTNFLEHSKLMVAKMGITAAFVGEKVDGYDSFPKPSTHELELLIAQSDLVYSRAGYTTIMEMIGLDKKACLIPTKGQYEQEYLVKIISHPNISFSANDDWF